MTGSGYERKFEPPLGDFRFRAEIGHSRSRLNPRDKPPDYRAQGRYADAEPLYKRSLAIWEKALGPDHPNVATVLVNYASLLRKTDRVDEAVKLEARAKAIRAKHAEENPAN